MTQISKETNGRFNLNKQAHCAQAHATRQLLSLYFVESLSVNTHDAGN